MISKKTLDSFLARHDWMTVSPAVIQDLSSKRYQTLADTLEDFNNHSELVVLQALRTGHPDFIQRARAILSAHCTCGFLNSDLSDARQTLQKEIAAGPLIIPRDLFEKMAAALWSLGGCSAGWEMPTGGPPAYAALASQALELIPAP